MILISCRVNNKKFNQESIGKYERLNLIFTERITVLSDATFIYSWHDWANKYDGQTSGQINSIGGQYLLNNLSDFFDSDCIDSLNEINIKVIDKQQNTPIFGAKCISYYKGNIVEGTSTEFNGKCKLYNLAIDKIVVDYLSFNTIEIQVNNHKVNSYVVRFAEPYMTKLFDNNPIKFKGDQILLLSKEGRMIYKKTPIGNTMYDSISTPSS